jgi:hypothetical protein
MAPGASSEGLNRASVNNPGYGLAHLGGLAYQIPDVFSPWIDSIYYWIIGPTPQTPAIKGQAMTTMGMRIFHRNASNTGWTSSSVTGTLVGVDPATGTATFHFADTRTPDGGPIGDVTVTLS